MRDILQEMPEKINPESEAISLIDQLKNIPLISKIKAFLENQANYTAIIVLLVAISSFGLGRQSVNVAKQLPVQTAALPNISKEAPTNTVETPTKTATNNEPMYVASKNGKAYHLLTCSGAKTISEKNKIYFQTKAEAEAAGYKPAGNCKGI